MTVAAVVLFARPEGAIADAAGRPAVRRIVESAWAGGATPIVVVSLDPDGTIAQALAGSGAVLAEPAPIEAGPVGQIARGIAVAAATVAETEGALVWPGRMAWVDAETVTTLIEAYGVRRGTALRPVYEGQAGWPVLVPMEAVAALAALGPTLMPDELMARLAETVTAETVDTGDPGTMVDIETPLDSLPAYGGPPQPVKTPPEWGPSAAESHDEDAPLEGPALAPYSQAAEEGD